MYIGRWGGGLEDTQEGVGGVKALITLQYKMYACYFLFLSPLRKREADG